MPYYTNTFQGQEGNYGFAADFSEELDDVEAGFVSAEAGKDSCVRITDASLTELVNRENKLVRIASGDVSLITSSNGYIPVTPVVLEGATYSLSGGYGSQVVEWNTTRVMSASAAELTNSNKNINLGIGSWMYLMTGTITPTSALTHPTDYVTATAADGTMTRSFVCRQNTSGSTLEPQHFALFGRTTSTGSSTLTLTVSETGSVATDVDNLVVWIKRMPTA